METLKKVWKSFVTWLLIVWGWGKFSASMFWDDIKSLWWKVVFYSVGAVYKVLAFSNSLLSKAITKLTVFLVSVRMKW